MTSLTVYITRPAAPLCERVCAFLDDRGYAYTTIDVVTDQDREAMRQRTGFSSCPLVLAGDHVIGKLEETIDAHRSGRLAALIPAATQNTPRRGTAMPEHNPTPEIVTDHPEQIRGYDYGTDRAANSPLSVEDLERLKEVVWLADEDQAALRDAASILADQADDMVSAYRARLGELPWMAPYSNHPDGTPNPDYGAASKPRFDRWIIDACTRPLDQDWLNYQHEIGLRHTTAKKTKTDNADSLDHIPMRYLLAFTAVVIATARDYLAATGATPEHVDRMHSAFTKSVMLHVTVWTRAYVDDGSW
jgi:glutaredoxin